MDHVETTGEAHQFLKVIADPHRWAMVSQPALSNRRVGELTEMVGRPQNLVSYHLRELRDAGLVSSGRSSLDGRDTCYRLNLNRCGTLSPIAQRRRTRRCGSLPIP